MTFLGRALAPEVPRVRPFGIYEMASNNRSRGLQAEASPARSLKIGEWISLRYFSLLPHGADAIESSDNRLRLVPNGLQNIVGKFVVVDVLLVMLLGVAVARLHGRQNGIVAAAQACLQVGPATMDRAFHAAGPVNVRFAQPHRVALQVTRELRPRQAHRIQEPVPPVVGILPPPPAARPSPSASPAANESP